MFTHFTRWSSFLIVALFAVLIAAGFSQPVQASPAPQVDSLSNSCLTCHENQYYLYDTGSSSCLADYKDRCVNCHGGDASVMKKEDSHAGLVLHPQENDGAKCKDCHTEQVTQAGLIKFEADHGYATVIQAEAYTPIADTVLGAPDVEETNPITENSHWLIVFAALSGVLLALVILSPTKP